VAKRLEKSGAPARFTQELLHAAFDHLLIHLSAAMRECLDFCSCSSSRTKAIDVSVCC